MTQGTPEKEGRERKDGIVPLRVASQVAVMGCFFVIVLLQAQISTEIVLRGAGGENTD